MSARIITTTVEGQTYQIPEMWLVGATRSMTYPEAILHWHEQAQAEAQDRPSRRAILRFHKKYIGVLCHMGHALECHHLDRSFGGSAFEAEIGAWQAGLANRFDRQSAKCQGAGHE